MCTVNVKAKSKGELPVTVVEQPQFPLTTLSHKERNAKFRNAKGTVTVSGIIRLVTKHQDHHSTPNASIKWLKSLPYYSKIKRSSKISAKSCGK